MEGVALTVFSPCYPVDRVCLQEHATVLHTCTLIVFFNGTDEEVTLEIKEVLAKAFCKFRCCSILN
jgi:hypothetical protein